MEGLGGGGWVRRCCLGWGEDAHVGWEVGMFVFRLLLVSMVTADGDDVLMLVRATRVLNLGDDRL